MISSMNIKNVIASIDDEIARLRHAKALLLGSAPDRVTPARRKRNLSPEARDRIVEAQRKRWAAQRKKKKK